MDNINGCRGAVPGGAARLQVRGGVGQPRPQRGHPPGRGRQADQAEAGRAGRAEQLRQVKRSSVSCQELSHSSLYF